MSEIRSQATPARDELAEKWRADLIKAQGDDLTIELGRRGASELLELLSPPKPRTVTSAAELMALPLGSLIRALLHEKQTPGTVFERVGKEWLELDPSDRDDGEQTIPSAAIFRVYKHGVFVLFTPGGE